MTETGGFCVGYMGAWRHVGRVRVKKLIFFKQLHNKKYFLVLLVATFVFAPKGVDARKGNKKIQKRNIFKAFVL